MSSNFFYNAYLNYFKIYKNISNDTTDNTKNQIIGYYDIEKNIWYHAWAIYNTESKINNIYSKSIKNISNF